MAEGTSVAEDKAGVWFIFFFVICVLPITVFGFLGVFGTLFFYRDLFFDPSFLPSLILRLVIAIYGAMATYYFFKREKAFLRAIRNFGFALLLPMIGAVYAAFQADLTFIDQPLGNEQVYKLLVNAGRHLIWGGGFAVYCLTSERVSKIFIN